MSCNFRLTQCSVQCSEGNFSGNNSFMVKEQSSWSSLVDTIGVNRGHWDQQQNQIKAIRSNPGHLLLKLKLLVTGSVFQISAVSVSKSQLKYTTHPTRSCNTILVLNAHVTMSMCCGRGLPILWSTLMGHC